MTNQQKAKQVAKKILNSGKSIEEIVEIAQSQSQTASIQQQILDGFNAAAQEQGRYAGGNPTLGDEILDKLAFNVKKYGKSAYKLSDKQVAVIIRDIHGYRKV
ncbi:hypothetical protein LCGC14_2381900 [marine sediment metagenome]|uniref:Uncharacterized protein n=1 Tax=marine sediment metagenome TaxID=412755 RepID=A0A0F9C0Q6_9ZZZZ